MQKQIICQPEIYLCSYIYTLFLPEGGAFRPSAVAGPAALDVDMIRRTLIIGIINAVGCLAVNTDGLAGMGHRALERVHSLPFLREALAAGVVTAAGMLTAHHNISLATQMLLIVGTIIHRTF